jgi:cation transport ATPase
MQSIPMRGLTEKAEKDLKKSFDSIDNLVPYEEEEMLRALRDPRIEEVRVRSLKKGDKIKIRSGKNPGIKTVFMNEKGELTY